MPTRTAFARSIAAAVALMVVASMAPGAARAPSLPVFRDGSIPGAPDEPLCDRPVDVPGQGPSCPLGNGLWQVLLEDGASLITHGPDRFPKVHGYDEFTKLTPLKPACVSSPSTQFHTAMIYAKPSDKTDRYTTLLPQLRKMVYQVNAMLNREARELGATSMRYRMPCSGSEVAVARVDLGINASAISYANVVNAVRRSGHASQFAKYWIWVDGPLPGQPTVGGQAHMGFDESKRAENINNYGPGYGVFYGTLGGWGAEVIMHEGAHSLGAVQNGAPNSTMAAHCIDDLDVMCYPDGGARASAFKPNVCLTLHFDCRHDDYFHPKPRAGSYLAQNWNLASPLNRFFSMCQYLTGTLTAGVGEVDVDGTARTVKSDWAAISSRTHGISSGCWSKPFALSGVSSVASVPGPVPYGVDTPVGGASIEDGNRHIASAPVDVDVCFKKGSATLKCFRTPADLRERTNGTEVGVVPYGATAATITVTRGAQVTYVLSVL